MTLISRLNLSTIAKGDSTENYNEIPQIQPNNGNESNSPSKNRVSRTFVGVTRNNLLLNHSDSSDVDLDMELEQIPVAKDDERPKDDNEPVVVSQVIQMTQLPDLDDDDEAPQEKSKLSILYDLLLTPEQCEEPPDEWNYKSFIREFAKSETNGIIDSDEMSDTFIEEDYEYDNYE